MSAWFVDNWKRYLFTALAFGFFVGVFLYLWRVIDRVPIGSDGLFFVTSALLILALTKMVFDSLTIQSAEIIEENVTYATTLSSHGLFVEIYKNSPVPYVIIDAEGSIISTNTSALRLFGITEGAYDGKNVFEYLQGKSDQTPSLMLGKLRQHVSVNDEGVSVLRPDGKDRFALLSLFSFTEENGASRGLMTLVDITKQKEIDRVKTEFVSLASHQLRSPISAMKWNMELLGGSNVDALGEEQRAHLEKVLTNLIRMETLVDDFLNVSKLELGTLAPEWATVDVEELCTDILSDHEGKIRTRNIVVEASYAPEVHRVRSDAHLLHMVLNNLVSNAVKYTPDGGRVRIVCALQGNELSVDVADTGIGIPAGDQDKIFGKIFRATNAKTQVSEGTGLGLYIAREAARVLGGTITFQSEEGKGTTFMVRLPAS